MDHNRFTYSPINKRPSLKLPNNARIAVWVNPNIEYFHYDKPGVPLVPMTAQLSPDVMNFAWRDYGTRVGIWRLIDIFNELEIPISSAINADVCLHYKEIIDAGNELNWEWIAHSLSNSVLHTGMPEDKEREIIKDTIQIITEHTGTRPKGWLGPALTETDNTLDILAECEIEYVADWTNDDQPYAMNVRSGSMYSLPYSLEINDLSAFLFQGLTAQQFAQVIMDQFDVLYEEGKENGRILPIGIHPFSIGQAFRAKHFKKALEYIKEHDNVWFATGTEIIDWYRQQQSDS